MRFTLVPALLALLCCVFGSAARAELPARGESLSTSCAKINVQDACSLIAEASKMLGPSYIDPKTSSAIEAFRARGYDATPWKAGRLFGHSNQGYIVSRAGENRIYVVIRGTDNFGDAVQDLKAKSYTGTYRDGEFYLPPGHGGFRRGVLNIINSGVLRINEFDVPLDCASLGRRASILARHLCRYGMRTGPGQVDVVLVGHSLGAGIALIGAAAFAGLEYKQGPALSSIRVGRQDYWPLTLRAVVAFAPPYAVYSKTDLEAGIETPEGYESQWQILASQGIIDRTILFINDRDLVPGLSIGYGRHFGHRFRIDRDDRVTYDGSTTSRDLDAIGAHRNVGYCTAVLTELHEPVLCE
jgi:pimeloyl-ACP methyl ester carboxylesterase